MDSLVTGWLKTTRTTGVPGERQVWNEYCLTAGRSVENAQWDARTKAQTYSARIPGCTVSAYVVAGARAFFSFNSHARDRGSSQCHWQARAGIVVTGACSTAMTPRGITARAKVMTICRPRPGTSWPSGTTRWICKSGAAQAALATSSHKPAIGCPRNVDSSHTARLL